MPKPVKTKRKQNNDPPQPAPVEDLDLVEMLQSEQWGLAADKRHELMKVMVDGVLKGKTITEKTKAFLAIVEARKLGLAAAKLLLDGKLVEHLTKHNGDPDRIPIDQLGLNLDGKVALLREMRGRNVPRLASGG